MSKKHKTQNIVFHMNEINDITFSVERFSGIEFLYEFNEQRIFEKPGEYTIVLFDNTSPAGVYKLLTYINRTTTESYEFSFDTSVTLQFADSPAPTFNFRNSRIKRAHFLEYYDDKIDNRVCLDIVYDQVELSFE